MVHSGYEASAVNATFSSLSGFLATVKATLSTTYRAIKKRSKCWKNRQPQFTR